MDLTVTITGTQPLLMHNSRLADPDDEFTKAIGQITAKRKKTEQDRSDIGRLEFLGGLYVNPDGPVVPTANIRKCFVESAKVTRRGKDVERAVILHGRDVPLQYVGPRDAEALWAQPKFRNRLTVGVGARRIVRVRPQFVDWQVSVPVILLPEILDRDDFVAIAEQAGRIEGLGDARRLGYGRFDVEVSAA